MYKVIRVSHNYGIVIVESGDDSAKTYHGFGIPRGERGHVEAFEPMAADELGYFFGGMANNDGFGELPETPFVSLEDVKIWRARKRRAQQIEMLRELLAHDDLEEALRTDCERILADLEREPRT